MAGEILAQLPADLQTNEAFTGMNTAGDLATAYLTTKGKVTEYEGKAKEYEGKITDLQTNSIPKLPKDATPEQKDAFYAAIGRPGKAEEYELPDEGKNSPEMMAWAKKTFHAAGVSKEQAALLGGEWNKFVGSMVEAHNASIKKEADDAAAALKTELGDKYDAGIALATRVWKKYASTEFADFDKVFDRETNQNRFQMVRVLLNIAKLTGEDMSPMGNPQRGSGEQKPGTFKYDKTPPVHPL